MMISSLGQVGYNNGSTSHQLEQSFQICLLQALLVGIGCLLIWSYYQQRTNQINKNIRKNIHIIITNGYLVLVLLYRALLPIIKGTNSLANRLLFFRLCISEMLLLLLLLLLLL